MTTITEKEVSQLRNHAKIGIKISKKVKELKEQIEELKEKNNGYEALLRCECGVSIERVVEIKEENKKLKRDIDGDGILYEGYKKELSNQSKQINRWCKDNVKLKQENEELKEENQKLLLKSLYREIRVDKLILEKKELKEKITMQSHDEDFMNNEMKIIWDENVKLIEELKLKDEIIKLHETS